MTTHSKITYEHYLSIIRALLTVTGAFIAVNLSLLGGRAFGAAYDTRDLRTSGYSRWMMDDPKPVSRHLVATGLRPAPSDVRLGKAAVSDGLDADEVQTILGNLSQPLIACHQTELISDPSARGRIVAELTIDGNGSVSRVKVEQSSVRSAGLETCTSAAIKALRFPASGEEAVHVKVPMIFKRQGEYLPDIG